MMCLNKSFVAEKVIFTLRCYGQKRQIETDFIFYNQKKFKCWYSEFLVS